MDRQRTVAWSSSVVRRPRAAPIDRGTMAAPRPGCTAPAARHRLPLARGDAPSVEFELLLADLPDGLPKSTGRELARERHAYAREFFDRLRREAAGRL